MAKKIIQAQMQQRRDTKANWAAQNPVLLAGELGIVSDDPNLYKVGDGTTAWNALPFRGFDGTLVHTTGDSETAAMSQKGVTEELAKLSEEIDSESVELPSPTSGYINKNGDLVSSQYYIHYAIEVKKGDFFKITQDTSSSIAVFATTGLKSNFYKVLTIGDGTMREFHYLCDFDGVLYVSTKPNNTTLKGYRGYGLSEIVKDLDNIDYADVLSIADVANTNQYARFSDGAIVATSMLFRTYVLANHGYTKIKVYATCSETKPAAIAFYSGDVPTTANYIASSSVALVVNYGGGTWYEADVPSDCKTIVVSNNMELENSPKILIKSLSSFVEEVSKKQNDITTRVVGIEGVLESAKSRRTINPTNSCAYTLTIGTIPSIGERAGYSCFRISVKAGDSVELYARSGDSFPTYALVKDNIVTYTSAKGLMVDDAIICDGTFNEVIVNNYGSYVSDPIVSKITTDINGRKQVKILMFGNSFTQDSMSYVPFVLKNVAPNIDVTLCIAYIAGCPLVQHLANLTNDTLSHDGNTYSPKDYTLHIYKAGADAWELVGDKSAIDCLTMDEWDIVTFQQAGGQSAWAWETYYAPFIYRIHKVVSENVTKAVKFGWLLVQGSYASTIEELNEKWEATAENSEKIQALTANQIIFPFGTAIRNLGTIASLADIGDGAGMTADNAHLHEGLPCLCAAYANALTILDALGLGEVSIIGEKTRPTKAWCTSIGVPGANYGAITNNVVGVTDDNSYYAQVAAIQAVKKPYEISDLANFVE